ncbi:MAG: hypothetical protein D6731_02335 [Planctomycetota bacterium]|nr:MAG: hypothetical protein D6731_02335 [Planctomycetota bacterium]
MRPPTKPCPHCAEELPGFAAKCRHCGEFLPGALPRAEPFAGAVFSCAVGWVLVALACVAAIIAASAVSDGAAKLRRGTDEREVVAELRRLAEAQQRFQERDPDGDGRPDFGTLAELGQAGLIGPDLASGLAHRFVFQVGVSVTAPEERWLAIASPMDPDPNQSRYYAVNHTGAVYRSYAAIPLDRHRCEFPATAVPVSTSPALR